MPSVVFGWNVFLLVMGLMGFAGACVFARGFRRVEVDRTEVRLPRAVILMGLKGADPYLGESLTRMMTLDYPDYELHIAIDRRDDPAWQVAQQAVAETASTHVRIEEFAHDPADGPVNSTNSKVVQLARKLDDSFEFIAMSDGDNMPHPGWLTDLVGPMLDDSRVGATFGNRWFMPPVGRWGSLVRYIWNAMASVMMYLNTMPWGGCFAIRAELVRSCNLVAEWARVIALDAGTPGQLSRHGFQVRFVPQLMMVNREECSVPFCLNFARRQLIWTRLYHPAFYQIVVQTLLGTVAVYGSLALCLVALATADWQSFGWAFGGITVYAWWMFATIMLLEFSVRRSIRAAGEEVAWLTPIKLWRIFWALIVAQTIQAMALLLSIFRRRVAWRGLVLEVNGPYDIRLLGEVAAAEAPAQQEPLTSL
ncbi:MAG: glycosyltransferase family 2 protein [Planctomycetota bacterium]|nr:MAG: glycosyltransferase family 2 protein [Planctomycetota bacterium]REK39972.1 MAG: glycosyltransferase family 2 protein [Planctomycetota bacterium]